MRLTFAALEPIHFPQGKSGNILRGAFGSIFRRLACLPGCQDSRTCDAREACAYARMFEPVGLGLGPSGFGDSPRPFVFRARHLDGRTIPAGGQFSFDLNFFDINHAESVAYFVLAFSRLATDGLGPGRRKAELLSVDRADGDAGRMFDSSEREVRPLAAPLVLSLEAGTEAVDRLRVRFDSPTELKSGESLAARPEFPILFSRARDRVSTLRRLYGSGPLEMDFRGAGERARQVRMSACEVRPVEAERNSSRTGQTHSIGGFVGFAEYEGDLGEFLPILRAAQWTGVGRQTVWGKGTIEVE